MKLFFIYFLRVLKSLAIFILAFLILSLINMLHRPAIRTFAKDGYINEIPGTPLAQFISICIIFTAGLAAAFVISVLSGKMRNVLLSILLVIFLIIDIQSTFGYLADTALLYRFAIVCLVPVEIWIGYVTGKNMSEKFMKNSSLKS